MIFKLFLNIPKGKIINSCLVWRWMYMKCQWYSDREAFYFLFQKKRDILSSREMALLLWKYNCFLGKERINAEMSWIHVSSRLKLLFKIFIILCNFVNYCIPSAQYVLGKQCIFCWGNSEQRNMEMTFKNVGG